MTDEKDEAAEAERGAGDSYQQETKYERDDMERHGPRIGAYPGAMHQFDNVPSIKLPRVTDRAGPSLWTTIGTRRSRRNFTQDPLKVENLSQLLWAAQGVTAEMHGLPLRSAPSAGGLYPIETYVVVNRVHGLDAGIYHYFPNDPTLEQLRKGDYSNSIAHAALDQKMAARAAVVLLWTAVVQRARWKYGQRAYRYIYMDAGHVGQNVALAAEGLGLGCCAIGAFYDDEVAALVGVDGEEEVAIYLAAVGHYKR